MRLPGDAGIGGAEGLNEGEDVVRREPHAEKDQNLAIANDLAEGSRAGARGVR